MRREIRDDSFVFNRCLIMCARGLDDGRQMDDVCPLASHDVAAVEHHVCQVAVVQSLLERRLRHADASTLVHLAGSTSQFRSSLNSRSTPPKSLSERGGRMRVSIANWASERNGGWTPSALTGVTHTHTHTHTLRQRSAPRCPGQGGLIRTCNAGPPSIRRDTLFGPTVAAVCVGDTGSSMAALLQSGQSLPPGR